MEDTPDINIAATVVKAKRHAAAISPEPTWHAVRKKVFIDTLIRNNGAVVATARELKVSRQLVWRWKKQLDLG